MSLLKHKSSIGDNCEQEINEWTLHQLCDVGNLIRIPLIVIVVPHCLKERGTVRLRSTLLNHLSPKENHGNNEEFVNLDSLAPIIKDSLIRLGNVPHIGGKNFENFDPKEGCDQQKSPVVLTSSRDTGFASLVSSLKY